MSMNFKDKFTNGAIGLALLTTVSTSALATKPGEHHHPKPPQTPDITIPVQVNGGSPKGGNADAYANGGKASSNSDANAAADANAVSQSGALSQSGANSQSGPSTSTAQNGGNTLTTNSHFQGGAMTGAPGMGFLMAPDRCAGAFGISVGGGAPFVGSGGIGFQKIDVAGVNLGNGYTLVEYLYAPREQRAEISRDLSGGDKDKLNCLTNAWEMQEAAYEAQERIEKIRSNANIRIETIRSNTQRALPGIRHFCNESVTLDGRGRAIPETLALRKSGHENCEGATWDAIHKINEASDVSDFAVSPSRDRRQQPVDSSKRFQRPDFNAHEGVPTPGQ